MKMKPKPKTEKPFVCKPGGIVHNEGCNCFKGYPEQVRLMSIAERLVRAECEVADRARDYFSPKMLERLDFAVSFALHVRQILGVKD